MQEIITKSPQETQDVAQEFAQKILPGDIITLSGKLGAGKTTFTQGLAKGLGIEHRIISPTFVVIRTYQIKNQIIQRLYHIDLYRIENEKSLLGLGLEEILQEKDAVVLIEWPEKMGNQLPETRWEICLEEKNEHTRRITIEKK